MKVAVAASFFNWLSLSELGKRALFAGFDGIEADLPRDLGELLELNCPPITSIHLPSITTVRWLVLGCVLARRIGSSIVVSHPTINPILLTALYRIWESWGVCVTVENIPRVKMSRAEIRKIGINPNWIIPETKVFANYGSVDATFDIGHAGLLGLSPKHVITALGRRLKHVHIHDYLYVAEQDHLPIGSGEANFRTLFEYLHQVKYNGTVVLEAPATDLSQQAAIIKSLAKEAI